MYEVFDHTADLGLRIRTVRLEDIFVEAARALFSLIVANPGSIRPLLTRNYRIESSGGGDLLLFDWLNELLYTSETEHLLMCDFAVTLDATGLNAVCGGERADPSRHQPDHEVKAITYHGLRLEESQQGWLAEVIVDI